MKYSIHIRGYIESDVGAPQEMLEACFLQDYRIELTARQIEDILVNAGIHPRKPITTCTEAKKRRLWDSVKTTLAEMTARGGRDTERDLFGVPGGDQTKLSKNTLPYLCRICGGGQKKKPI